MPWARPARMSSTSFPRPSCSPSTSPAGPITKDAKPHRGGQGRSARRWRRSSPQKGKKLIEKHFSRARKITRGRTRSRCSRAPAPRCWSNRKKDLLKRLECAWNESPLGVWLDKNSWVLYVFAPIVIGAAGSWMYVAKTGDDIVARHGDLGRRTSRRPGTGHQPRQDHDRDRRCDQVQALQSASSKA